MAATKKPAAKSDVATATAVVVEAIEPIRHDGSDVLPGDHFTMTPEAAAALIASGAARAAE